jgi:hypothetical protein
MNTNATASLPEHASRHVSVNYAAFESKIATNSFYLFSVRIRRGITQYVPGELLSL